MTPMIPVVFVAMFLVTSVLIDLVVSSQGRRRTPRPSSSRARPTAVVLALLAATVVLGLIDIPPAVQVGVVGVGALVLAVISGRQRDAHGPQ